MPREESGKRKARREERQRQKKRSALLGALFAAALLTGVVGVWLLSSKPARTEGALPTRRLYAGEPMPAVAWNDPQGNPVNVADYAGKPLIINAWATWCPPCKAEMPLLQAFYEQYQPQGLTILAVDAGEDARTVLAFWERNGITFPVVIDASLEILARLGISSFPTSVVVGRDGIVKHLYVGQLSEQQLSQEITRFLELK